MIRWFGISMSALASLAFVACSGSDFGGSSKRGGAQTAPTGGDRIVDGGKGDENLGGEGGGPALGGMPLPSLPTAEQRAIAKCLAAWGTHPFDPSVYQSYRKISASVSILSKGYALEDVEPTQGPKLILVSAAIGILGDVNYLFMNPNGWYCIDADVNVLAKSRIDLHCSAHLADTKVNVEVLSEAQGRSGVGVAVLSDVEVNRISRVDPREGC